jgi:hypothetical protein
MIKSILLFILISSAAFSSNHWDDKNKPFFQQRDNQSHILINAAISNLSSRYAYSHGYTKFEAAGIGLVTGLLFGLAKEHLYDKHPDSTDLQSWALGSAVGATFFIISF